MSNNKKILSVLLALIMALSVFTAAPLSASAVPIDGFNPEPNKVYVNIAGADWGFYVPTENVAFYFFGGDFGTEANPTVLLPYGSAELIGKHVEGLDNSSVFEFDPASVNYTFTPGVKYQLEFYYPDGNIWRYRTAPVTFTADMLGHLAACSGSEAYWDIYPASPDEATADEATADETTADEATPDASKPFEEGCLQYYYHLYEVDQDTTDIDTAKLDIVGYTGTESDVVIPATINGLPVVGIAKAAFAGLGSEMTFYDFNYDLKSITIPDTVTEIGGYAFYGCELLTEINIPDSVTKIGECAFSDCYSLTSVTIPDSVTEIGECAFSGCYGLTSVTIPDSVTEIGEGVFNSCSGLTSIDIPDAVTVIGEDAFSGCYRLTSIDIPDAVTEIGKGAFRGCSGLTSVSIPDAVTAIVDKTFCDCWSLTDVSLPDTIEYVSKTAFQYTPFEGLWYNDQPDGVLYWGTTAVEYKGECPETLEIRPGTVSVKISGPVSMSEGNYDDYDSNNLINLKTLILPEGLQSISGFRDCANLTSVTIPRSVTSFDGCHFGQQIRYESAGTEQKTWYFPVTVYGYSGSAAEEYVNSWNQYVDKDNNSHFHKPDQRPMEKFTFVPLDEVTDESGVKADLAEGQELSVTDISDTFDQTALPENTHLLKAYDIDLMQDGGEVQPDHVVTVKIPCNDPDAKVYRREADGTLTDMNAEYKDGYLIFKTPHFSTYVVATGAEIDIALCGDADGDGEITAIDVTLIQRCCAGLKVNIDPDILMNADVDGNGDLEIIDATYLQRYLAKIAIPYPIGERV